jgi:ATP-dependent Lon protease
MEIQNNNSPISPMTGGMLDPGQNMEFMDRKPSMPMDLSRRFL